MYLRQTAALEAHRRERQQAVEAERDWLEQEVARRTAQLTELAVADVHALGHARRGALAAAGRGEQHLDQIVERLAHRGVDRVEAHGHGVPVGALLRADDLGHHRDLFAAERRQE